MTNPVTLRKLIEQNPEWADLPLVVYNVNGDYEYVGGSASVYNHVDEDDSGEETDVLVFAGN